VSIDPSRVAVVVPPCNEAGKIGAVVRKVPRRFGGRVIVVDDASSDGTAEEARAAGAEDGGVAAGRSGAVGALEAGPHGSGEVRASSSRGTGRARMRRASAK